MRGIFLLMVFLWNTECLAQRPDSLPRLLLLWAERDTSLTKLETQYTLAELEKIQYAKDNAELQQKTLQKELENQKLKTYSLQQRLLNEYLKSETEHKQTEALRKQVSQSQRIRQLQVQQLNQQVILQDRTRNFLVATVALLVLLIGASLWYNRKLFRKNKEIQDALLKGQTIERRRVAADLHDNLGGMMSAIQYSIEAMDTSELSPKEKEVYQSVLTMTQDAYKEIRLLSHNLQPDELERFGLLEALRRLVNKLNKSQKVYFELKNYQPLPKLPKELEFNLYSICLELSSNIMKHSGATEAVMEVSYKNAKVQLLVVDNGKGYIPNNTSDGMGMRTIQERVQQLGGTLKIQSEPDEGTLFRVSVPTV
ncbi:MAG: sensor histidine kinase [Spirosomataceae bacterium]